MKNLGHTAQTIGPALDVNDELNGLGNVARDRARRQIDSRHRNTGPQALDGEPGAIGMNCR